MKKTTINTYERMSCMTHFLFFVVLFLFVTPAFHNVVVAQGNVPEPEKPSLYVEVKEDKPKIPFFQGFTLSADVYGIVQYLLWDYGGVEGALRLNLKNTSNQPPMSFQLGQVRWREMLCIRRSQSLGGGSKKVTTPFFALWHNNWIIFPRLNR